MAVVHQKKLSHSLFIWILLNVLLGIGGIILLVFFDKNEFNTVPLILNILCFITIGGSYGFYFQYKSKIWSLIPQKHRTIISLIIWIIGFSIFTFGITISAKNNNHYIIAIALLGIDIIQCSTKPIK